MPNAYQRHKARLIAATLLLAATQTDIPMSQLALLASHMSPEQWRTVSFQAGVAVADKAAQVLTVALLARLA
jgi:hypothetical protein